MSKRAAPDLHAPFKPPFKRSKSSLAPAQRREINRIAKRVSIRSSTTKSFQTNAALSVPSTGVVSKLSAVALGTTLATLKNFERDDTGILPTMLTVRYVFRLNSALSHAGFRLLIVRTKPASDGMTPGNVLDLTPNGTAIVASTEMTAGYELAKESQFDILWDSGETVNNDDIAVANEVGRYHQIKLKLSGHQIAFQDGTNTATNHLYLLAITGGSQTSTIEFTSDLRFIDK